MTRGLNEEGNAANFVETEHIITYEDKDLGLNRYNVLSHVQIRGSIPLHWSMKPNMKWSPPVIVCPNKAESMEWANIHIKETKGVYGEQYWVNLIDKKGGQKRVGDAMTDLHSELNDQ